MFYGATAFNQPIGSWDTSNVQNISWIFYYSPVFNQPLNWNLRSLQKMDHAFQSATVFNQNLGAWNTSSVISMSNAFASANSFTGCENGKQNLKTEKKDKRQIRRCPVFPELWSQR